MNEWKHFLRLDPMLTEMAKNIFGDDIIESAYVYIEGSGIDSDELYDEMYKKIDEHIDIDFKKAVSVMCGPEIMMKSVSDRLNKLGLSNSKIYWNMERRMECAIGSCGRCLIQDVYVCRDGPVFRYDQIKEKIENEAK